MDKDERDYSGILGLSLSLAFLIGSLISFASGVYGIYIAFALDIRTDYVFYKSLMFAVVFPRCILFAMNKTLQWNYPGYRAYLEKVRNNKY